MSAKAKRGGQRRTLSSRSGKKKRSPTSRPHRGSRVEPSHITERAREKRAKKTVRKSKSRG